MCSSFRIKTSDGHVFFVFNFEAGGDNHTKVVFYPKGTDFSASAPEGRKAASWSSKYAVAGMGWYNQPMLGGGVNEHGLACANLNLPMFTEYQTADEKDDGKIIAAWDVPTYFLTQCKSVEEVKAAIPKIKVIMQLWHVSTAMGKDVPVEFHYTFHDQSGASMVLEYIDGEPKIYDNELGVLTNSPNFEWQRTNLSNYIHLSTLGEASKQVADVQLTALGSGAGMLGLPGDYTPPSRFVRTTALCHTAEKTKPSKSHAEGLQSAFRLSNTISFPEGISGEVMGDHLYLGKTDFQMVADTSKKVMYFKHYEYPNWQSLDVCALAQDNEIPLILDPSKGPAIPSAETQFEPKE